MKVSIFKRVVCICLVVLVFASSAGVSFIKHHCTATRVTKLFVNEMHDCSSVNEHEHEEVTACNDDHVCSCAETKTYDGGVSVKCENCCKDSLTVVSLDMPINVSGIGSQVKTVCIDVVLFFSAVVRAAIDTFVEFARALPPLISIFNPDRLIHFISVLRI